MSNDIDFHGDQLTTTLVSSVSHGNLNLNLDRSFSYTPTLTYRAHDGISSSHIALVTLTVRAVNDPPVALDDFFIKATLLHP